MKKIKYLFLLLCAMPLSALCQAQTEPFAYTIAGQPIAPPQGTEARVIYYSSAHCHQCMVDLVRQGLKWKKKKRNRELYVMLQANSIPVMRSETSAAESFFQKGHMPIFIYDLNPDTAKRYENIYKIYRFPALLSFDKSGNCTYHSYDELFSE